MKLNKSDQFELIWIIKERKNLHNLKEIGIKAFYERDFFGIFYILRSKFIIGTHSDYCSIKSNNQYLIDLWHGMPLKAMGFSDNLETPHTLKSIYQVGKSDNFLIASSRIMKNALIASFLIDPRKVIITGQPRNDKLFLQNENKILNNININTTNYNTLILFAPTFRSWGNRVEGIPEYLKIFESNKFINFLKEKKILLILKLHPYDEEIIQKQLIIRDYDNINLITNDILEKNFLDIYDILSNFDILITDYSSIFFDFLLLNKPLIFYSPDIDQYSSIRGFLLEPYDFWTPGPKVKDIDCLIEEITKSIMIPGYYKYERNIINSIVNKYTDGKSCERVWKFIETVL